MKESDPVRYVIECDRQGLELLSRATEVLSRLLFGQVRTAFEVSLWDVPGEVREEVEHLIERLERLRNEAHTGHSHRYVHTADSRRLTNMHWMTRTDRRDTLPGWWRGMEPITVKENEDADMVLMSRATLAKMREENAALKTACRELRALLLDYDALARTKGGHDA